MITSERKLHVEPQPKEHEYLLKVAFCTVDRQTVNQHFGTGRCVLIYGVSTDDSHLLEAIEYPFVTDKAHDKLSVRIEDLSHCSAVYCNACGPAAIRQLLEQDVHPVKVREGMEIQTLISEIQNELSGTPMGWLGRAIKNKTTPTNLSKQDQLSQLMDEEW